MTAAAVIMIVGGIVIVLVAALGIACDDGYDMERGHRKLLSDLRDTEGDDDLDLLDDRLQGAYRHYLSVGCTFEMFGSSVDVERKRAWREVEMVCEEIRASARRRLGEDHASVMMRARRHGTSRPVRTSGRTSALRPMRSPPPAREIKSLKEEA